MCVATRNQYWELAWCCVWASPAALCGEVPKAEYRVKSHHQGQGGNITEPKWEIGFPKRRELGAGQE